MKKRIFIKDWQALKPYEKHSSSDVYYLELANEINQILHTEYKAFLIHYFEEKIIDLLAIFLVSYFEDIISETHIFPTFVKKYQELYGKKLPFYNTDEYDDDEINIQDIQFLIWYFLNTLQDEKLLYPAQPYFEIMASNVMQIFEREYEYAPENKVLQKVYELPENATDYYKVREFIQKILFDSYLFKIDTGFELTLQQLEIVEERKDDERLMHYINGFTDNFTSFTRTKLLALSGKEWGAYILGKQHPLHDSLLNISKKITGLFFYKGQDDTDVFLEHIASGKKFKLTKKSFNNYNELKETDNIIYIGIIRWKDEWWFSGSYSNLGFDANLVLNEKNSVESRKAVNFLDENTKDVKETLRIQQNAFKAINNNKQIAFMPAQEVEEFIKKFTAFYNNSLNISEKKRKEAIKSARKDGFFREISDNKFEGFDDNFETAVVFFNPKGGVEMAFEVASSFPDKDNPFYKPENEAVEIVHLFVSKDISAELANYCIDNYQNKLIFLRTNSGKIFKNYTDFLLRFYKKEHYYSQPQVTMVGKE